MLDLDNLFEDMDEEEYVGVVCFDYDGTLVSKPEGVYEITKETIEALDALRDNGYLTVLASGRSRLMSEHVLEHFDGLILLNGSFVSIGTKVLRDLYLPEFQVQQVAEALIRHGLSVFFDCLDDCYSNDLDEPSMDALLRALEIPKEWFDPWDENADAPVYKFVISYQNEDEMLSFIEEFQDDYHIIHQPKFSYADMNPKGITKGDGVRVILEETGLPKEKCYVFGDGNNDIPMFLEAGTGIAMGNHTKDLGAIADMIAKPVNENGVAIALKELGLI